MPHRVSRRHGNMIRGGEFVVLLEREAPVHDDGTKGAVIVKRSKLFIYFTANYPS